MANKPVPPIYFARHGETEWNRLGLIQGWTDTPLNATGELQAKAVALAMRAHEEVRNASVYQVSPLTRTRQTMAEVAVALSITDQHVIVDERLKELGFGVWEGKPFWELKDSPIYPADPETRYGWRPEGGESYEDGQKRIAAWLAEVTQPTIVVSHGALGRCLIGHLTGMSIRDMIGMRMPQGRYCRIADGVASWFDGAAAQA